MLSGDWNFINNLDENIKKNVQPPFYIILPFHPIHQIYMCIYVYMYIHALTFTFYIHVYMHFLWTLDACSYAWFKWWLYENACSTCMFIISISYIWLLCDNFWIVHCAFRGHKHSQSKFDPNIRNIILQLNLDGAKGI